MKTTEILSLKNEKGPYADVYSESKDRSVLENIADRLSEKFHSAFPLVKGRITRKERKGFLAVMEKGNIRMKWPLVVGSDTRFAGNAVMDQKTEGGICRIRLESGESDESVLGNWVITQ